jgi:hypothetical protein
VEAELFDAYARGKLPAAEQQRVEKYLLNSENQRQKLAFARRLQATLEPRRRYRWLPLAGAAALVLVLGGATGWLARQNAELRAQLAALPKQPATARSEALQESVLLQPTARAASQPAVLAEPRPDAAIRIELTLDPADMDRTFSVSVNLDGRTVWRAEPIRAGREGKQPVASFWIDGRVLTPGNYIVQLTSSGTPVDYYPLRVVQRSP